MAPSMFSKAPQREERTV